MGFFRTLFHGKRQKPQPFLHRFPPCDCGCWQFRDNNNENTAYSLHDTHELCLHTAAQNEEGDAWKLLQTLIEKAITDKSREFAPGSEMPTEMWRQIVTLPLSIARLKSVRKLSLYDSYLVRIPAQIGAMENLRELDIYGSYHLHWLPYEVTHCRKLKLSRASTRALYGNHKYRPAFPKLGHDTLKDSAVSGHCSVCGQILSGKSVRQVWISRRVATDVFPLLVNACSEACIRQLPAPANGYVDYPHNGGLGLQQPKPGHQVRGGVQSYEE